MNPLLHNLTYTTRWAHESGWQVAGRLPAAVQGWLADPQSWPVFHGAVSNFLDLPLVLTLAVVGGLAALTGLFLWEEARQQALREGQGRSVHPAAHRMGLGST